MTSTQIDNTKVNNQRRIRRSKTITRKVVNLHSYNCSTTIDTIELNAKLSTEQRESIYNLFAPSRAYPTNYYRYNFHLKQYGFTMKCEPVDPYIWGDYNIKIILHKSFNVNYVPFSIIEILNTYKWSVKLLHIAFDFNTDTSDSLIYKHHLNLGSNNQSNKFEHVTDYIGAYNSSRRSKQLVNYDVANKLIFRNELKEDEKNKIELSNRFEVRLAFKMNELLLSDLVMNPIQSIITEKLNKYIFIPSISNMSISEYDKRSFKAIKRNQDKLKSYDQKQRNKLKMQAKDNRYDLALQYNNSITELYKSYRLPYQVAL